MTKKGCRVQKSVFFSFISYSLVLEMLLRYMVNLRSWYNPHPGLLHTDKQIYKAYSSRPLGLEQSIKYTPTTGLEPMTHLAQSPGSKQQAKVGPMSQICLL